MNTQIANPKSAATYNGTNTIRLLNTRKLTFIVELYNDGCRGPHITRKDVVRTALRLGYVPSVVKTANARNFALGRAIMQHGMSQPVANTYPWPSWLTSDMQRRVARGLFAVPELTEYCYFHDCGVTDLQMFAKQYGAAMPAAVAATS